MDLSASMLPTASARAPRLRFADSEGVGPVSRPHVLLGLGLACGCWSEQLEALDHEVELLDAVPLDVADP